MLTIQEQQQILKLVRKMIRNDRTRRTKVKNYVCSGKKVKESEKKDFEELHDLLKELG